MNSPSPRGFQLAVLEPAEQGPVVFSLFELGSFTLVHSLPVRKFKGTKNHRACRARRHQVLRAAI